MTPIPENLASLHGEEEAVRRASIEAISGDRDLSLHLELVERSMDLLDFFVRSHRLRDEDDGTIQLLGVRLFNGLASALKLLFGGYYQTAALQVRDVLEVVFLLDLFGMDRTEISRWRGADKQIRMKFFAPVKVRTRLDERDGYKERKRQKLYDDLSELAGHATQRGFMLLSTDGSLARIGPFFDPVKLKAVLEDTASMSVQAGMNFRVFFPQDTKEAVGMKLSFIEMQNLWAERFLGIPFDRAELEQARSMARAADLPSVFDR